MSKPSNCSRSSLFLLGAILLGGLPLVSDGASDAFIPPKFKNIILRAPVSDYPGGVRYYYGEHGVYRLKINPRAGTVDEVSVMRRASQAKLNATVVLDFMKWKFQPGSVSSIDVPVEFERGLIRPELKSATWKK